MADRTRRDTVLRLFAFVGLGEHSWREPVQQSFVGSVPCPKLSAGGDVSRFSVRVAACIAASDWSSETQSCHLKLALHSRTAAATTFWKVYFILVTR